MDARAKTEALVEILDSLPVGIAAATRAGEDIYANTTGDEHAELAAGVVTDVDGKAIQVDVVSMEMAGQTFDVRISHDVTAQRDLEEDLFRRAYFDNLTGLPNRALAEQSLSTLVESDPEGVFGVAFFDLDGFKNVNDYYGHLFGDSLLVKVAERLSRDLRPGDLLARVGGDEFVLVLSPIEGRDTMADILGGLLERLKAPFFIDRHEVFISASIGACTYPADGRNFETLCANADRAMYRGKGATKGTIRYFDHSLDVSVNERMRTEQRLRLAIRDRRLLCAYQPKFDFRANKVTGLEVLLRWRDEEGLIHPPGDFVELAVDLGLMDEITHLVLAETVSNFDRIDAAFGPDVAISINVAAKQADQPSFMRTLVDALVSSGSPQRFIIEVTEEAFLAKGRFQKEVLPMIRAIGARVSIDDFGVGYSSLATLADVTADEIKVDRSFITAIHQRPRSQSILRAIESLADALGMAIMVEGVETFEELAYLQAATRIRVAQGYYFARPQFLDALSQQTKLSTDLRPATTAPRESGGRQGIARSA